MTRGLFVAFEGIDGSGKSTQAKRVANSLSALLTFEPGDTKLGQALRQLLLHDLEVEPTSRAEALLMAADRSQHVETVIEPALASGKSVITDRYNASTLAYQGFGRGLGLATLVEVLSFATGGLTPDLTIVVDCDLATAKERSSGTKADRLEQLDPSFHAAVRQGFLDVAQGDPTFVIIDGNQSLREVERAVDAVLETHLGLKVTPS